MFLCLDACPASSRSRLERVVAGRNGAADQPSFSGPRNRRPAGVAAGVVPPPAGAARTTLQSFMRLATSPTRSRPLERGEAPRRGGGRLLTARCRPGLRDGGAGRTASEHRSRLRGQESLKSAGPRRPPRRRGFGRMSHRRASGGPGAQSRGCRERGRVEVEELAGRSAASRELVEAEGRRR
ncbi:uncharacterized protein A4U43_C09F3100 [Asparagus officinalis]|uniref:Uncharacterized protein n=1 Tax=Asparagus officinalis TaxID=4686 RepID=A0A5P1E6R2_ASPOF|nr:uncharacterized protein A4U43_C09F3100 [Asparagus officinalis]